MKDSFRKVFLPLLNIFESGDADYQYKPSHRKILLVVAGLFITLSIVSATAAIVSAQIAGLIPCAIFFVVGVVCGIIGLLGNDHAVAKIWGNK